MDIIKHYFKNLTPNQIEQFAQLFDLYKEWNDKINVISRKDIDTLYERHVLHSLAIAKFLPFQSGSKILDIGTGGGFPGIPLAIMFPECHFHLTDSIGKKIKVVQEVATALGLNNVQASHMRSEDVKDKYDFVVSRAVAELALLVAWSRGKIMKKQINAIPNGLICLKGGDLSEELKVVNQYKEVYDLKDYFIEEFFDTKKLVYVSLD
ncbi:MAG: 16S rRNA (guanine(527)-N(7))-methyltransferase RsmG [Flavobacteriales bacterium]